MAVVLCQLAYPQDARRHRLDANAPAIGSPSIENHRVGLDVTPRVSLRAGVELGVIATGATARDPGQPVAAISAAWTSLGLAAVIDLRRCTRIIIRLWPNASPAGQQEVAPGHRCESRALHGRVR